LTRGAHVGVAVVTSLACVAVVLWLFFAPGNTDDNAYGLA
jgi:hypothetical protein